MQELYDFGNFYFLFSNRFCLYFSEVIIEEHYSIYAAACFCESCLILMSKAAKISVMKGLR